jgi:hypothetical protein
MLLSGTNVGVIVPAWLPQELYNLWLDAYIDAGGSGVQNSAVYATDYVRSLPEYESFFPGIKRDDGTIRYAEDPELTYYTNVEAFRNTVIGAGMLPDVFGEEYIDLIKGDVSPNEFSARVNALEDRVLGQGPAIHNWYAANYGLDLTSQGILAGLMSSRVNDAILMRQITMAEIGGEAEMKDFDITTQFVGMLEQQGMNRAEAQQFFGTAEAILPVLGALAQRHGDPDDDFDLMELAQAQVFLDAGQMKRMQQLVSQEEAMFTGGAQVELTRSQSGGLGGLEAV